jgi:hypothetical protein
MHTRHHRGRIPAFLLSSCLCALSACALEPAEPPESIDLTGPADLIDDVAPDQAEIVTDVAPGALPPLAYTLSLTYGTPPFIVPRPATLSGHLYLVVDAGGAVTGTISARDTDTVSLATISGHVEGTDIVIQDGSVAVTPGGMLGLDELRIVVRDDNGDGAIDGASGTASGSWQRALGDIFDFTTHTSTLTASRDTTSTTATLFVPRSPATLLPFEPVTVRFQEPLREQDVRTYLRIRSSGVTVPGTLTLTPTGGLVTSATFQPSVFLGFGASVTLGVTGLRDPAGNALTRPSSRVLVAANPGPLTGNIGFESGLAGWIALGQASALGAFQGFAPAQGATQAVVREGGTLAGYLDVPATATELELSVAVLSEIGQVTPNHTAVIALRRAGGALIEIFDVADVAGQFQPCATCTEYGQSVGPLRRTIDLTPHRGQRVFLTVDVRSSFFIGVNFFAALVDDIQPR